MWNCIRLILVWELASLVEVSAAEKGYFSTSDFHTPQCCSDAANGCVQHRKSGCKAM
jgi:hypothetical protein